MLGPKISEGYPPAGIKGRRLRLTLYVLMLLAGIAGSVHSQSQHANAGAPVYRVDIDGVINPGAAGLLQHAIDTAEANEAAALVLRIDTPGGLVSTTRDMVSAIAESRVPIIGYVGPSGASATSAGAFILLSTHVATMNVGTNVGASSPVSGGGGDIEGTMGKKVMNDTRAFMRSVANSRGRNADLAERFVSEAESVTATEAQAENVIDLVVTNFSQLLEAVDGREIQFRGQLITLDLAGRELRRIEPRLIDRVLQVVAHPQIAHMLISLGFLAIYIEILSPGLAFPGVFGAIAVVLGLVGVQTLPVNIGFLVLLILGVALMVAEFFVAGIGVLGIGGAVAFVLGSINLFDTPMTEEYQSTILWVSIAVSTAMVVSALLITRSVLFGLRKNKCLEGKTGEAMVNFDKDGFVLVDGERWSADTQDALQHGDPIVVVSHGEDDRLLVKKAPGADK